LKVLALLFPLLLPSLPNKGDVVTVVEVPLSDEVAAYRSALSEMRPPLRGFRAPILEASSKTPRFVPEFVETRIVDEPLLAAITLIVKRLAKDGLCTTLVHVIDALDPQNEDLIARVEATGFPLDLLSHFTWEATGGDRGPDAFVSAIAERLAAGTSVDQLAAELSQATFAFEPTGYRVATESGERDIDTVRLQFTRGDTWLGDGDGSNLDLARQVVEALPEAHLLASVETRHAEELLATLSTWDLGEEPGRVTLTKEALVVSQWAQDNGKPGYVEGAAGWTIGTLVPRYASRGEGGSTFVPGESFLADGLAAAGHEVVHSPLLFQGGNMLAVHDPKRDERVLLVGEAEVYRNVALGLTREQALDALRIEFGVDRCIVLPAASFHIDAEVTLRSHGGELIAFVNDDDAAIAIVLECATDALERAEKLAPESAALTREAIAGGDWATVIETIGTTLGENALTIGRYAESFAKTFETSATDPGTGNLQTCLFALDRMTGKAIPIENIQDLHARAYLNSFEHMKRDRQTIRDELERNGWRVVPVPSLPGGSRGLNYINAVHDRTRSLVPAYGGLYARLDRAALDVYERTLSSGGFAVSVVPILAAESQRRSGAVHCSVAAYPVP
jgi:hypothetical protein